MTYEDLNAFTKKLSQKELEVKIKDIEGVYVNALDDIEKEMAKVYGSILKNTEPTEYYKELVKFDRLDKLKKSLLKNYAPTTKRLTQITVDSQTQAFTNQYYYNHQNDIKKRQNDVLVHFQK